MGVLADTQDAGAPQTPTTWERTLPVRGASRRKLIVRSLRGPVSALSAFLRTTSDPARRAADRSLKLSWSRSLLVRDALAVVKPDVIHVQHADYRPLYLRWSGHPPSPTVITVHGLGTIRADAAPGLAAIVRDNLSRADTIITPSKFLADEVSDLGVDLGRVRVIPNAVDHGLFRPREQAESRALLGLPDDTRLILYAGRATESKGATDLIRAFASIREGRPDTRLAFVGPCELDTSMREHTGLPDGDESIMFAESVPRERLPVWLGAADVVVVPSRYEGFGLVALEAMACGRPVVASAVGGLLELVSEETGMLVPPCDDRSMAAAVGELLDDRDRSFRAGRAAVSRAAGYTWSATAKAYLETYAEVASERPVGRVT